MTFSNLVTVPATALQYGENTFVASYSGDPNFCPIHLFTVSCDGEEPSSATSRFGHRVLRIAYDFQSWTIGH
jgi:hypothetical protein